MPGVWIVSERSMQYARDVMHEWNVGIQDLDEGRVMGTRMLAV